MEISDQCVHYMKVCAGIQKDIGIAAEGLQWLAFARQSRGALQRSDGSGTDADHPATSGLAGCHGIAAGLIYLDVLAMHGMIFDTFCTHGLKRPRAHMEGHFGLGNARRIELRQ